MVCCNNESQCKWEHGSGGAVVCWLLLVGESWQPPTSKKVPVRQRGGRHGQGVKVFIMDWPPCGQSPSQMGDEVAVSGEWSPLSIYYSRANSSSTLGFLKTSSSTLDQCLTYTWIMYIFFEIIHFLRLYKIFKYLNFWELASLPTDKYVYITYINTHIHR